MKSLRRIGSATVRAGSLEIVKAAAEALGLGEDRYGRRSAPLVGRDHGLELELVADQPRRG